MKERKAAADQPASEVVEEEYKPPSDWARDPTSHVLLLDLTGFKKDDLKLQVDSLRNITVSGKRLAPSNKRIWFDQKFQVPEDCDVSKISGKFDNGLLFITMAKQESAKKEDQKVTKKEGTKEEMPAKKREEMQKGESMKEVMPAKKREEMQKGESMKEVMPANKREEMQKGESMKEGMPTGKEGEKVQDEKIEEEAKPEEGVIKDEGQKIQDEEKEMQRKEEEEVMTRNEERQRTKGFGEKMYGGEKAVVEDMYHWVMEKINNNKAVIATAIVGISLGLYISFKLKRRE